MVTKKEEKDHVTVLIVRQGCGGPFCLIPTNKAPDSGLPKAKLPCSRFTAYFSGLQWLHLLKFAQTTMEIVWAPGLQGAKMIGFRDPHLGASRVDLPRAHPKMHYVVDIQITIEGNLFFWSKISKQVKKSGNSKELM